MTDPNDKMLDDMFVQMRDIAPKPSDALMARVLADAASVQATPQIAPMPQPGLWARAFDIVGGWPAVSGLATATVAGIWIGVAPPASVQDITASWVGDAISVSLLPTDFEIDAGVFADG